jgi:serine/threonine protein phosphatase PrpC
MGENYFGITDKGRQRTNNEDRFIAQTVFDKRYVVACVIDGVGGYNGGEIAAQLTRDEIISGLHKLPKDILGQMVYVMDSANEKIIREKLASPQNDKMACVVTLSIVDIENNTLYFAHVGDTRLYLFRDGSLIKITRDHSSVGFLEESGRLTEEAAMSHPKRNEVNKVLGYESGIANTKDFIDTGESPFLPGDTILLCSDGLTDMVPSGKIRAILSSADNNLKAKGRLLINAANDAGGKDNITVVLVHNDKSRPHHEVTRPQVASKTAYNNDNGETQLIEETVASPVPRKKAGKQKKNRSLLLFIGAVFLLVLLSMLYRNYKKAKVTSQPAPALIEKHRNQQETDFLDSLNTLKGGVLTLTGARQIIISDSIFINKDSLHIIGNGCSFGRDSAYGGPAFILSPSCKYILLDSIIIENFNVGICVLDKGLHLKNVRFRNCLVPLQFQHQVQQGTPVSGHQAENVFYYTDSVKR